MMVPDVDAACKRFEDLGVEFVKKPSDGKMKGIAFIKDPDGYWIEIFNNKMNLWVLAPTKKKRKKGRKKIKLDGWLFEWDLVC